MLYTIRNKEGTMIAEIADEVANVIMAQADGFWRSYKITTRDCSCFEITEEGSFTLRPGINGMLRVFLWKGYILIPENS